MDNLKILAGYYYLALAMGYKNKNDIIQWADNCIEQYEIPYDFIELSLSGSKSIEDILSILQSLYAKYDFEIPMCIMLGQIRSDFIKKIISVDDFFSYINSLNDQGCISDKAVNQFSFLDRLSDGYYLATERIYGEVEDIALDALEDLKKYEEYTDLLKEGIQE
ncbi:hypothetical protein H1230_17705 [Paenibacillus sp. 19GGS1-52]|uniref:hypothetical protein n=1 Tax=Paenibacillus sp. 19GGS1-52 TaxID=2758563 RepID=UPI001EFA2C3D|nr:hypothetical protein [Paenibacillus sp. 19GGS1-52]ULO04966.1 hypothetical protein H1230_17705 [Paenibacillus sp. 19GGS1-52]